MDFLRKVASGAKKGVDWLSQKVGAASSFLNQGIGKQAIDFAKSGALDSYVPNASKYAGVADRGAKILGKVNDGTGIVKGLVDSAASGKFNPADAVKSVGQFRNLIQV